VTDNSFTATVVVSPPTATIELDGEPTHVNSLARRFPRDGRHHVLRASADGFAPFAVEFVDAPPPPSVTLVPLRPIGTRTAAGASRPTHTPQSHQSARDPQSPTAVLHSPAQPTGRPVINGAPVLHGE
jgi:hypothetical protein